MRNLPDFEVDNLQKMQESDTPVSAWAAEQPCTRPSTREQTPSEEDQVADGLREPCAAEEGPNSGAGEAETVTAALIAQSLASGLASIEHGAAPRVTAAMAEEAQHWSDGPCEGDVHLAPEEDKEVDSQRTQIPSLATTSTTTTKTTTKTTTTGGAVPATQEHLQAEAHLGSPGDTAMLLAPIQQDTAAQAESAGKLFSDGDRTKNGGRTESFCQEEPDRNLQDMEDSETVVAAWAYLEGIAAPGCGEDGIVCAPAERASCSSFATPSCSSSSIVDTGSQVAVGSDANLVGAECELAPTASSSADAVPSAFAHVPPLPPSAGTESSVAVESIPTTAPAPAPPAAPATTSSSTTNTASAPASCTGADAHVAARSSSQVLELLSGECVGEDAPRQPPARVAAIVEPQQSDSTPGAVASAAATACVEALRGACPSSDDSRGAKRVGGSLASTAAASDGPDQKRAKLSLCFRRSAPPAPAGAQRVFPLGDVNRVITECFNQNKPLHALKVLKAMRLASIAPDRAQWELFQHMMHSTSPGSADFLIAFGEEMIDVIQGGWPTSLLASMPPHMPVDVGLAAAKARSYKMSMRIFASIFSHSMDSGLPLSAASRSIEVLEAYLEACLSIKVAPMSVDDLIELRLAPSPDDSRMWSMAASAYALAHEPKAAMDLISHAEANAPAIPSLGAPPSDHQHSFMFISAEAETDLLCSAVCSGLDASIFRSRMSELADRGVLTASLCGDFLDKLLVQGGGRVDMVKWQDCLQVIANVGVDLDVRCHMTSLQAALGSRDAASARKAMAGLHGVGGEAGEEFEQALWLLEEREKEHQAVSCCARKEQLTEEQLASSIANLEGKNPQLYMEAVYHAAKAGKEDLAVDAWLLLIQHCGVSAANDCIEVIFSMLAEEGLLSGAMLCSEAMQNALLAEEASGGKKRLIFLSHDAITLGIRQCVVAPREMLGSWVVQGSEGAEKKHRAGLIEGMLALAHDATVCSQALYTNAMQALEALVRDDAGSVTPFKANDSVREVMMACHESMRDEGIVPSIESYHIIVTAAGFAMFDTQRVYAIINEMRDKAGVAKPTAVAREALICALAQTDPVAAEKELEALKNDGVSPCERCIQGVVQGLINEGEPKKAFELARMHGCCSEQIKLMLLQGFVACGELESALEMFGGFHEASTEMPREFEAFVRAIRGHDMEVAEENADDLAARMREAGAAQGADGDVCMDDYHEGKNVLPSRVEGDVAGGEEGLAEKVETLERFAEGLSAEQGAQDIADALPGAK